MKSGSHECLATGLSLMTEFHLRISDALMSLMYIFQKLQLRQAYLLSALLSCRTLPLVVSLSWFGERYLFLRHLELKGFGVQR